MKYNNKAFNLLSNLNLDLKKKITKVLIKYGEDVVIYYIGNTEHVFTFDELVNGDITVERFESTKTKK